MMNNISDEQIAQMNWCDIRLSGVSWIENGRHVVLNFLIPPIDRKLRLTCRWTRGLRITLEFESGTIGYALSLDGEVKRNADGALGVELDFADAGQISLVCDDLEFSYDDAAETLTRSD